MNTTYLSKKSKVKEMTILAMFIAIIAVMSFVPYLGYITIGPLSATIIPIPVIIGGILLGRKNGLFLGLAFGIFSMIKASMSVGFDYLFIFPWVSVLPRTIFGLVVYDVYRLIKKLVKKQFIALVLSFFVLSMIHSMLVLPMLLTTFPLALGSTSISSIVDQSDGVLAWLQSNSAFHSMMVWMFGILASQSLIEAAVATVIGSIVTDRLLKYLKLGQEEVSE